MRRRSNLAAAGVTLFATIWLAGCYTPKVLKSDYREFADTYGDASNQQMLLNLARLANHEPVYFLQLGSFSSQYTFTSGAGFTPSAVKNTPGFYDASSGVIAPNGPSTVAEYAKESLTLGGSANLGMTHNPVFQYLPLAGTNLTGPVLTPVSDKIFFNFYDQGYPADILARMMVGQVQRINKSTGTQEFWMNDATGSTYSKFLGFCALLKNAQQAHALVVRQQEGTDVVIYFTTDPKLADVTAAVTAGLSVSCETNSGLVTVKRQTKGPSLIEHTNLANVTLPPTSPIFSGCATDDSLAACNCRRARLADDQHAYFVGDTQTAEHALDEANTFATGFTNKFVLSMRTVESAMYDIAREEQKFRERAKASQNPYPEYPAYTKPFFGHDQKGPYAIVDRPPKIFEVDALPYLEDFFTPNGPEALSSSTQPKPAMEPTATERFVAPEPHQSFFSFVPQEEASLHGYKLRAPDRLPGAITNADRLYPLEKRLVGLVGKEIAKRPDTRGLRAEEVLCDFKKSFRKLEEAYRSLPGSDAKSNLVRILVEGLNQIVESTDILLATKRDFSRVVLRPETVKLATKLLRPSPFSEPDPLDRKRELKKENIMVLEDAFPQALSKHDFEKNPFNLTFDQDDIADVKSLAEKIAVAHDVTPEAYLMERISASGARISSLWNAYTNKLSKAEELNKSLVDGLLNKAELTDYLPPELWARSSFKVRPLMRLTCQADEKPATSELVSIRHRRGHKTERYFVGDPIDDLEHGTVVDISQNRTVFTILTYLFAQASVSTQNLPVQQLIQVH